MNKQEWQPINPCISCDYDGIMNQTCPKNPDCFDSSEYYARNASQKKLLEYLIANTETGAFYTKNMMRDMLKQLDKSIAESDDGQLIDRGSFAKYVEKNNE